MSVLIRIRMWWLASGMLAPIALSVLALGTEEPAFAQAHIPGVHGPCIPISERAGRDVGCWVITTEALGQLSQRQTFWHLDTYPSRAEAEAAKEPHGTVVESFGKIWVFTIAEAGWRPSRGARVAEIGPLQIRAGEKYSALYMESVFTPGLTASAHRHSGPEAWYTLAGATCLETPEGKVVGRAGGPPVIVPGGSPMHLTAIGTEQRRSLVLILHESSQPASTQATDWTPKGLCKN